MYIYIKREVHKYVNLCSYRFDCFMCIYIYTHVYVYVHTHIYIYM